MNAQNQFELQVPAHDSPPDIFSYLNSTQPSQEVTWSSPTTNTPNAEFQGITLEIVTPGNNKVAPDHPDFLNFRQVEEEIPFFSIRELRENTQLQGERRRAVLRRLDGRVKYIAVQIMNCYRCRIKGIDNMLVAVDAKELDLSGKCNICHELYVAASDASQIHHEATRMAGCGHVFCRGCITQWLKRNDTCPLCRDIVKLPLAYKLRALVRW